MPAIAGNSSTERMAAPTRAPAISLGMRPVLAAIVVMASTIGSAVDALAIRILSPENVINDDARRLRSEVWFPQRSFKIPGSEWLAITSD